jgi:hypothetical protein
MQTSYINLSESSRGRNLHQLSEFLAWRIKRWTWGMIQRSDENGNCAGTLQTSWAPFRGLWTGTGFCARKFESSGRCLFGVGLRVLMGERVQTSTRTFKTLTLLWWDYSEGGSKWQACCLNFDRRKKVVKISRKFLYKEVHVTFWRPFCLDQHSNNLTHILTTPQNSLSCVTDLFLRSRDKCFHDLKLFRCCNVEYQRSTLATRHDRLHITPPIPEYVIFYAEAKLLQLNVATLG